MTRFNIDDPRITAYALGELEGDDAALIEAQMNSDPALAAAVDEARKIAELLRHEFATEPAITLTAEQRERIETKPTDAAHVAPSRPWLFQARQLWMGAALAAAASLAIALILPIWYPPLDGQMSLQPHGSARNHHADHADSLLSSPGTASDLRELSSELEMTVQSEPEASTYDLQQQPSPQILPGVAAPPRSSVSEAMRHKAMARALPVYEEGNGSISSPPPPLPASLPPQPNDTVLPRRERPHIGDDLYQDHPTVNREGYNLITDNPFVKPVGEDAISTFSIDVDTASYSNVRRFLNMGQLPPRDAVRIEEMLNYFTYSYEAPSGEHPFAADIEVNAAPWNPAHRLVRIGLKGKDVRFEARPAMNLVFLIDVSGSMRGANRLPLVKRALKLLAERLDEGDRLAIVTYAGTARLLLDSVPVSDGEHKRTIINAIESLQAGGAANGSGGIELAYDIAQRHFIEGGVNRVILCSDGDFNVGVSSDAELVRLIQEKRNTGVFLSVLGFGMGNYQDAKMEQLSGHGNGNFAYIDNIDEARKVLVEQLAGTLIPIAKDVKIQVDFNPAKVGAYRLIGYENRLLAARDFADDRKDAGEIGSGHTVTALYEIIPADDTAAAEIAESPQSEFIEPGRLVPSDLLLKLKIRYKQPDGHESRLLEFPVQDAGAALENASDDYRFTAAVAQFGMLLRHSPYKGDASFANVLELAESGLGEDPNGYRREFIKLVQKARALAERDDADQP